MLEAFGSTKNITFNLDCSPLRSSMAEKPQCRRNILAIPFPIPRADSKRPICSNCPYLQRWCLSRMLIEQLSCSAIVSRARVPSFPRNITDRVLNKLQGVALELNKHHGIVLLCNVKLLMTGKIGFITVFDAISSGRQSGQKIQCLYGNPMANNVCQIEFWELQRQNAS